jgi:uncharacterized membrane protein YcaP (DUF421 family)
MIILYRMMGKREVGELKIGDLVVSILVVNIVAMGIENYDDNLLMTILPVFLLSIMQIILSKIAFKYERVRVFIDGEPSVIINRGKVNFNEMLKQRYNLDDLLMELRSNEIKSIEEVDYAILEVSGRLSIFRKNNNKEYPLPVILDGKVDEDVLLQIGKDREWLDDVIEKEGYLLKDIFYGFYRNDELFFIKNKNN